MGRTYRDLVAGRKSMGLVEHIYECTRRFPREEV